MKNTKEEKEASSTTHEIRTIDVKDFYEVERLERNVKLLDNSIAIVSTKEEIVKCLDSGLSSGVFINGELVCYDLAFADEYKAVSYSEKSYTKKEHRGKGYMKMTIEWLIDISKEKDYVYVMCMVSPTNIASTKVVERAGFKKVTERNNVYGSTENRNIFVCELK